jgi:hypothetical protein
MALELMQGTVHCDLIQFAAHCGGTGLLAHAREPGGLSLSQLAERADAKVVFVACRKTQSLKSLDAPFRKTKTETPIPLRGAAPRVAQG